MLKKLGQMLSRCFRSWLGLLYEWYAGNVFHFIYFFIESNFVLNLVVTLSVFMILNVMCVQLNTGIPFLLLCKEINFLTSCSWNKQLENVLKWVNWPTLSIDCSLSLSLFPWLKKGLKINIVCVWWSYYMLSGLFHPWWCDSMLVRSFPKFCYDIASHSNCLSFRECRGGQQSDRGRQRVYFGHTTSRNNTNLLRTKSMYRYDGAALFLICIQVTKEKAK